MSNLSAPEQPIEAQTSRRMSSRTKAIVAITAGTALLLGGGGTLAYWSTEQALTAGTVTSGDLDLALNAGATWTLKGVLDASATPIAAADVTDVRIVPGDVLTLTQPVTATLVGDTLEADLTVTLPSALAPAGDFNVEFEITGMTESAPNTFRLSPADSGTALTATLTITFDENTPDRDSVNTAINLDEVTFTLTQASS